jgi:hypothetical protein
MAVYKKNHYKSIKTRKIVNGIIFNHGKLPVKIKAINNS